jgi:hypothetical protein
MDTYHQHFYTFTLQLGSLTISAVCASFKFVRRRQASASDLFPSPAGSAARARKQPTSHRRCFGATTDVPPLPPRAVAASSQLRLPSPTPIRLETPGRSVVGPSTLLPALSLAKATLAVISTMIQHRRPKLTPCARHLVTLVPPLSPCRRPASLASRALRQPRQQQRTICPPPRSTSSRFRAIQSRPEPVKCGVRRIFAFSWSRPAPVSKGVRRNPLADELGVGPQADDPAGRPTRAPGRSELLAARRPAPADGPRRSPPTKTKATCLPAALPESSALKLCRFPQPWAAS